MTGTIPKNAGSTSKIGSQKARALCGNPRRSFHFFGPSGFPLASHGCQGRSPGFRKFVRDRTETRRKLKVARGHFARKADFSAPPRGPSEKIHVHGGSSRPLTGEIGLSEIENVFAEVSICPETIKLLQKSTCGTHFEATVTFFEYSSKFGRKSRCRPK